LSPLYGQGGGEDDAPATLPPVEMSTISSNSGFSVDLRENGRRTVLAVSGEVDLATSPALRSVLETAFASGASELWIDFRRTTFMDSSGLHAVLDARARAENVGSRLEIVCPPGPVRRLFDIVGYSERLSLRDTPDE
jgi:anti-sigma B factor antagonist